MDLPENCDKCTLFHNHYSDMCCGGLRNRSINYPYPKDFRQEWCPLKEIPTKKEYNIMYDPMQVLTYKDGWNECLDKITG